MGKDEFHPLTELERGRPNRCQGSTKGGQCLNDAVEGQTSCKYHGGQVDLFQPHVRYRLANDKTDERFKFGLGAKGVHDLTGEIVLLEMSAERMQNSIDKLTSSTGSEEVAIPLYKEMAAIAATVAKVKAMNSKLAIEHGELFPVAKVMLAFNRFAAILNEECGHLEGFDVCLDRCIERAAEVLQELREQREPKTE